MILQQQLQQAVMLHQAGRLAEAEPIYARALREHPNAFPVLHLMGLLRYQQGQLPEALKLMERALKVQPGAPETLGNYGMALQAAGRGAEALKALDAALQGRPNHGGTWSNRGTVLGKLGRHEEALRDFDRALALEARNPETHHNRALALNALRRFEAAVESFSYALQLKPDYAEAWHNRGNALRAVGRHAEALRDFERVLALSPRNVAALLNQANALWSLDRLPDALKAYDTVLAVEPNCVPGLVGRSGLLMKMKMKALDLSIADAQAAMRISPDFPFLRCSLMHHRMMACDWRDFASEKALLDADVRAGKTAAEPFGYQAICDSPADLQRCARVFCAYNMAAEPHLAVRKTRRPGRIRIGYVAGEFHNHATSILGVGMFECHDRERFEIFAFDNGVADGSPMRQRLEAGIEHIVPIGPLSDGDAARRILEAEIDILVNLNGHVGLMRTGVFARKPAQLQVNYLGFPGTMGAAYMDYILADHTLIGEDDQQFYDEKIAWLPDSYQINDSKRARPVPGATRAAQGLPDAAFVFSHFNASYKITPDIFAAWMRILRETPGSVLWLLEDNELCAGNLRRTAAEQGIDGARLIFAPLVPQDDHMARIALADLFLDSLPCNAHTTASDALWAGLPLLTCRGNTFAGRVAASLLRAAGLPELVTETLADYEAMALALARDPAKLTSLRDRLDANRATAPLFDTVRTTRQIEAAYAQMHERQQRGESPLSFAVAPD